MAPPICFTFLIPIYPEANSRATRVSSTQYLRAISAKGEAHRRGIRELRERRLSWLRSGVVEREKRVERRRLLHGLRRGPPETAVVRKGLHQGRAPRQYLCVLKCKNVTLGTPAAPPKTIKKKERKPPNPTPARGKHFSFVTVLRRQGRDCLFMLSGAE